MTIYANLKVPLLGTGHHVPLAEDGTTSNLFYIHDAALKPIIGLLTSLLEKSYTGKDYEGVKPTLKKVNNAICLLKKLNTTFSPHNIFSLPFTTTDENGDIVFEWRNEERELSITVDGESNSYLKSWGENIFDDMEDGELNDNNMLKVWFWLKKI